MMMRMHSLPFVAVIAAAACWVPTISAQAAPSINGTWFGSIVLTDASGKTNHDTSVLVVTSSSSSTSGGLGRTIDQMTPWVNGSRRDHELAFHLDAAGGLDFVITENGGHLAGKATGPRLSGSIDLRPAPGLLPHEQLQKEIMAADEQLYTAFAACDVAGYAALLSRDLEFYQDHTGKTGYKENLVLFRNRCAEGIKLRRHLDEGSVLVNAAPGFGAIQAGLQQFYAMGSDGQEHLEATARFTNVWSKASGNWQLARIISYDHR